VPGLLSTFFYLPGGVVALHGRCIAHLGTIWIQAELAAGAALLEQIPTLVQRHLEAVQARLVIVAQTVVFFAFLIESVLIIHELPDLLKNRAIVHFAPTSDICNNAQKYFENCRRKPAGLENGVAIVDEPTRPTSEVAEQGAPATAPAEPRSDWPALPLAVWQDTRDTLHMWTQIVGKIRLALEPMVNHWWQVPLYVNASGLTTSVMPSPGGGLEIAFDFQEHVLRMTTVAGERRTLQLEPRSVADFYHEIFAQLAELGVEVRILARPVEVEVAIPFAEDEEHASYDAEFASRFWRSLVSAHRALTEFRSRFIGKVSPVHFFWGGFDLAVTRFSGREAPLHPGGVPNCAPWVMQQAYSHEVSSCGYWPSGGEEGVFYSYAYPEPGGFRDHHVKPTAARYDEMLRDFILPYHAVRTSVDPEGDLQAFLQTTYEAAANLAGWDRNGLEIGNHE
jgi:Family of unknown function (DUF5996)